MKETVYNRSKMALPLADTFTPRPAVCLSVCPYRPYDLLHGEVFSHEHVITGVLYINDDYNDADNVTGLGNLVSMMPCYSALCD